MTVNVPDPMKAIIAKRWIAAYNREPTTEQRAQLYEMIQLLWDNGLYQSVQCIEAQVGRHVKPDRGDYLQKMHNFMMTLKKRLL